MKKRILFVTLAMMLVFASYTKAQINFGAEIGANLANSSWGTLEATQSSTSITSFHVGPIVEFNIADGFYLQSGLLLSGKGGELDEVKSDVIFGITYTRTSVVKMSPLYLEIPINAMYKVDLNGAFLQVYAGPYLGLGLGGKFSYSSITTAGNNNPVSTDTTWSIRYGSDSTSSDMKMLDFGVNVGVGVEYNNFLFKVQYGLGLANLSNSTVSTSAFKNAVIGISVGYMFGDGGGSGHKRSKHKRRR